MGNPESKTLDIIVVHSGIARHLYVVQPFEGHWQNSDLCLRCNEIGGFIAVLEGLIRGE